MPKSIQLTDLHQRMSFTATLAGQGQTESVVIGPLALSIEDFLRLAEYVMITGPITEHRREFKKKISELVTGEGPQSQLRFRPSIERQMAGTHTGMSRSPLAS